MLFGRAELGDDTVLKIEWAGSRDYMYTVVLSFQCGSAKVVVSYVVWCL